MIAWLVAIVTFILVALIVVRRISPQFRRRSELPKHLFLANLGVTKDPASGTNEVEPKHSAETIETQGENNRESH